MHFLIKVVITAFIVAGVSELAKRFTLFAAIIASLPLTATLAMIWLYRDTHDSQKIIDFSWSIFWAVIPSQFFFIALPFLLKSGMKFPAAMTASIFIMFAAYLAYVAFMRQFGIKI